MKIIKLLKYCRNKCCKPLLTLLLISVVLTGTYGQVKRGGPPPLRERIFFGGSASVAFGSVTSIEVSPLVGIWLLPPLAVAAGPTFMYFKDVYGKTNIMGARTYVQLVIVRDLNEVIPLGINASIFFHAEDELLSMESAYWNPGIQKAGRFYVNTALIGGGIGQPMGGRSSFQIMVLWALNNSDYGLYGNPEIRIGFVF